MKNALLHLWLSALLLAGIVIALAAGLAFAYVFRFLLHSFFPGVL